MGFITELISGDKRRAQEMKMAEMQAQQEREFMKQMDEQNKRATESNQKMFDAMAKKNEESNAAWGSVLGQKPASDSDDADKGTGGTYAYNSGTNGSQTQSTKGNDPHNQPTKKSNGSENQITKTSSEVDPKSGVSDGVDYGQTWSQFDNKSNSYESRTIDEAQGKLDKATADSSYNPFTDKQEGNGKVTSAQKAFNEDRVRAFADMYGLDYIKPGDKDPATGEAGGTNPTGKQPQTGDSQGVTALCGSTGSKPDNQTDGSGFKDLDSPDAPWAKDDKGGFKDLDPQDALWAAKGDKDKFVDLDRTEGKTKDEKIDKTGKEFDDIAKDDKKKDDPAKTKKIDELENRISDVKGEIDQRVKDGEISKEAGESVKVKLDAKLKAAKDGEGTDAADKALKEVNTLDNNLNKAGELKDRVADVRGEIDARVESGELSKEEGEKVKAKIDKKIDAAANGEVEAPELIKEINALDNNLNKLSDLNKRSDDVTGEINQRVKDGELTKEAGDKAKADISGNVGKTRENLLDLDSTNKAADDKKAKSDDEVLADTGKSINDMDNYLNKLAGLDDKADAAKDRIGKQVADGTMSKDEGKKLTEQIDAKQKVTELATLEWA